MEKERRVKWLVIVSLIVAVLGLTIAFAALSETLTINGTATLDAAKWGIKFNNLTSGVPTGDAIVNNEATIADDKVTIENIDVTLKTPGDSVTYKVDLLNEGTINAEISNIKVPELTEEQKRYIEFKVTYDTGEEVAQGDILNSGATKNLTIKIEFKKDIEASDLPSNAQQINLSYKLDFVQTDDEETTEGSGGQTGNYGNEIRSWDLSDTVKMTYYNGELQSDGTYDNGDLVISGTGAIPGAIFDDNDTPTNIPVLFKLADISSFEEFEMGEDGLPIFKYNPTNLIIEEGITKIGIWSFASVLPISNITLSSTVTEIGQSAFVNCTSLTSIYMPNVTTIGENSFSNCTSLETINLPNVTTIDYSAFSGCTSLSSVNMPNVTTIDTDAFNQCSSLTSLNLPKATIIGSRAFEYCTSLRSIDLPEVITLENTVFHDCTSLISVNIPKIITIRSDAFIGCSSLKSINLPNSLNEIGSNLFSGVSDNFIIYVPDEKTKNKITTYNYGSGNMIIVVDPTKFN